MQDYAPEPAVKLIQEEFPIPDLITTGYPQSRSQPSSEREEAALSAPSWCRSGFGDKLRCPDLQALPAQSARQYSLTEVLYLPRGCNAWTPCGAAVPGFIRDFTEQGMEIERNSVRGNLPSPHLPHPGNNHKDSAKLQSLANWEEMCFYRIPSLLDFTYKIRITATRVSCKSAGFFSSMGDRLLHAPSCM